MANNVWEGIVKVQRPISGNMGSNALLIYNEERTVEQIMDVSNRKMKKIFPEDEYKVYYSAHIGQDKMLSLDEMVEEQDW